MELMIQPLKKYADFSGRARRSEYWLFQLFQILLFFGLAVVGFSLDAVINGGKTGTFSGIALLLYILAALAFIVPSIAVSVRRLHDSDKSGWMLFMAFIPIVGPFIVLVFTLLDGTPGPNRFGPDPKGRLMVQAAAA